MSLAYSFNDPKAEGRLLTQYFEILGCRGIYHKGWMASAFGPRAPWVTAVPPGIREWTPDKDTWELYNLDEDWSQANDLASKMPEKVAQMKELFLIEATKNNVLPIGGGLWIVLLHPELRPCPTIYRVDILRGYGPNTGVLRPGPGHQTQRSHHRRGDPCQCQWCALQVGRVLRRPDVFREDGILCYEYNLFEIQRTKIRAREKLPTGKVKIEVETSLVARSATTRSSERDDEGK